MFTLPTLEELTALSLDEVQALIRVNLDSQWTFDFEEREGGVWVAEIKNAEGETAFVHAYPDERLTLFSAYGYVWRKQYKPSNPVWQRRRDDLRVAARSGLMHLPGAENVPDPGDLDPESVYDFDPTRRDK